MRDSNEMRGREAVTGASGSLADGRDLPTAGTLQPDAGTIEQSRAGRRGVREQTDHPAHAHAHGAAAPPAGANAPADTTPPAKGCSPADTTIPARRTFSKTPSPAPARRIKKIPVHLRQGKPSYLTESVWHRRMLKRLQDDSQYQRSAVQLAFALLCLWIGAEFALFMRWGMGDGTTAFFPRPPGVEGFLPISALISLKYWFHTGIVNNVHPSGLIVLVAIVAVSVVLKKSFCSWLCPVGTLSESLWMLGRKLFGRTWDPPRWLDYPLRSLKYLLMGFFVYSILQMDVDALRTFIYSPYNKMADVKMYLFFADISSTALWTIIILVLLSVVIRNFWCRYLCPYGALLGLAGWLSPLKITRNKETCVDCELCTKACPSRIKVHTVRRVWSDECMNCMACVAACPVKETLDVRASAGSRPVPTRVYGVLVAGVFAAIVGMAMLTGFWQNDISREEYKRRFDNLDAPVYQHFRGQVPDYGPTD